MAVWQIQLRGLNLAVFASDLVRGRGGGAEDVVFFFYFFIL